MNPALIEIKQERPGFNQFISSWVYTGDLNFVVDVGPANSITRLIEPLKAMNLERVDYVLTTHIHLDHAGGLADFLDCFPMAKALCHRKGIRHLVDPSKLWAGSRKALGEVADFYGPMKPVMQEKLISHTEAVIEGLDIIETPGHAPHHISYIFQGNLFAGEAGGNFMALQDHEYLRPATPPLFFLEECLGSVDRLLALKDQPIFYGHYGWAESSKQCLKRFRDQLLRWEEIIRDVLSETDQDVVERCLETLIEKDPDLKPFEFMDHGIQERERFFLTNSIRGYLGYLKEKTQ